MRKSELKFKLKFWVNVCLYSFASDRIRAAFASPDPDTIIQRQNKHFPVPSFSLLARASTFDDGVNRRLHKRFVDCNLQLNFAPQISREFIRTVSRGIPGRMPKSLAIHNCQTKHFDLTERRFDRFKVVRLDDGDDELHFRIANGKGKRG